MSTRLRGLKATKPHGRNNFGFVYNRLWQRPLAEINFLDKMRKLSMKNMKSMKCILCFLFIKYLFWDSFYWPLHFLIKINFGQRPWSWTIVDMKQKLNLAVRLRGFVVWRPSRHVVFLDKPQIMAFLIKFKFQTKKNIGCEKSLQ